MVFCTLQPLAEFSPNARGNVYFVLALFFMHSLESSKDRSLLLLSECVEPGGSDWANHYIQITTFQNMSLVGKFTNAGFCFCNKF